MAGGFVAFVPTVAGAGASKLKTVTPPLNPLPVIPVKLPDTPPEDPLDVFPDDPPVPLEPPDVPLFVIVTPLPDPEETAVIPLEPDDPPVEFVVTLVDAPPPPPAHAATSNAPTLAVRRKAIPNLDMPIPVPRQCTVPDAPTVQSGRTISDGTATVYLTEW